MKRPKRHDDPIERLRSRLDSGKRRLIEGDKWEPVFVYGDGDCVLVSKTLQAGRIDWAPSDALVMFRWSDVPDNMRPLVTELVRLLHEQSHAAFLSHDLAKAEAAPWRKAIEKRKRDAAAREAEIRRQLQDAGGSVKSVVIDREQTSLKGRSEATVRRVKRRNFRHD